MTKTAFIVGASRGLGLGLVREYLSRGWQVIATTRGPSDLDATRAEAGDRLLVETLDVTRDDEIAALAKTLGSRSLDLLFVNAGISIEKDAKLGTLGTDVFVQMMLTNTLAPMRLLETFAPQVDRSGAIAVMSSGLGSTANNTSGGWEVYRATKAALNMAVRSFSARHKGATLLTMAPGWVRTDMGGPGASLDVGTSVRGLADVIAARSGQGGAAYVDYKGAIVPW